MNSLAKISTLFCFTLSFYCTQILAQTPSLQWGRGIVGTGVSDRGKSVVVDNAGNVYITGFCYYMPDLDPGPGVYTPTNFIGTFLLKLDGSGNFVWAKEFGDGSLGNGHAYGIAIKFDTAGNIYMTGYFDGTIDFNPGAATYNLSTDGVGLFILKLNQSGNFVWAKKFSGDVNTVIEPRSMALDVSGNIYTTGQFSNIVDFDPGVAMFNLTAPISYHNMFISKLDNAGNFVWAKKFGTTHTVEGNGITLDTAGDVYTTGSYYDSVDFDPGPGIDMLSYAADKNIFISKLDSSGSFMWAKKVGSTQSEGNSISIDASNNVYVSGTFLDGSDFDPGPNVFLLNSNGYRDIFVTKFTPTGDFIWAKNMGSPVSGSSGSAGNDYGQAMMLDANAKIYTTGKFSGVGDFDPGAGVYNIPANPTNFDVFISKLDSSGNFVWAKGFGGNSWDEGNSIAVNAAGNIYTTGSFRDSIDLDPDLAGICTVYSFSNFQGIFIQKLHQCQPTTSAPSVTACDSYTINNQTYTTNGTYIQTISNSIGCDSIITLHLTLHSSSAITNITQHHCNSITFNGQTYTATGVYTQNFLNAAGCDSNLSLHLTIDTIVQVIYQTACHAYTFNGSTYTTSGTYSHFFISASGCDSMVILYLTIPGSNNTIIQNGAQLNSNMNGATYQWVICPSYTIIAGATNQSFTATSNGDYAVIVTQAGCTDTSSCVTVTGVGVNDYLSSNLLEVSPNPTHGQINIASKEFLNDASIQLVNSHGQTVFKRQHVNGKEITLDFSAYTKGIYFLEINISDKIERVKIELN